MVARPGSRTTTAAKLTNTTVKRLSPILRSMHSHRNRLSSTSNSSTSRHLDTAPTGVGDASATSSIKVGTPRSSGMARWSNGPSAANDC